MNKYVVVLIIPLFFACGRADREKAVKLQAKNDSLMTQASQKDLAINDFVKSVNDIQGLLDSIKIKEEIISRSTQNVGEVKVSTRDQIRNDIASIYSLMLKNKHEMETLSGKLKSSRLKLTELQKIVDHLQKEIADKDNELAALRDKLANMDRVIASSTQKIDTLNNIVQKQSKDIADKSQIIDDQTTALNTAYYILGTSKELKNEKVIKGRRILPDFNRSVFTKVDIRNVTQLPIQNKKAKVLSNHPSTSFKLKMQGKKVDTLQITDGKAFWSNTKYLVVVTD